ncbi:MAG: hypothetical protein M3179_13795 [Actinomycetota bacterium]|nr:hypothetical protein [Actinomycetota bacterium]
MAAFLASLIVLFAGIGIGVLVGRRRPVDKPLTWGEAFIAGTFVFAMMLVAYGIAPHQWLDFADNELLWRKDKLLLGISGDGLRMGDAANSLGGTGRILINYEALRDIVAALIYVVFFAGQLILWSWWQKRGKKRPQLELTSSYARPVIKRA